jgi:hypothetical protein
MDAEIAEQRLEVVMCQMRSLTIVLVALALSSGARAADECNQAAYVEQCLLVSADGAACSKACTTVVAEIKQRCEAIRKGQTGRPTASAEEGGEPAFCKIHLGN